MPQSTNEWVDVSAALHNGMVHWPGDEPFQREQTLSLASGGDCNLSKFTTTAHIGTHMDAPRHFVPTGPGMEAMPLDAVIGPARVIAIDDPVRIPISELEPHNLAAGARILFRTRNTPDAWKSDEFAKRFVYIPEDTAKYLAARRVRTVGVDYLSVGGFERDGPQAHRALLEAGIWIIEGLRLDDISPGEYDLVCLPLKMVGSDGAPARAILKKR